MVYALAALRRRTGRPQPERTGALTRPPPDRRLPLQSGVFDGFQPSAARAPAPRARPGQQSGLTDRAFLRSMNQRSGTAGMR